MATYFKLDDFDRSVIEEISTFSGHSAPLVREVLELVFLRQIESYMSNKKEINIPFLGKMKLMYQGDDFISGARVAKVDSQFEPSDLLRRIVGGVEDGESDILNTLMQVKVKSELQQKFV